MAALLGYARVSTAEQDVALQRDALEAAGCYRVFVDHASGALTARPALTQVLDQLRPDDTLVVWRLDRLGRSLRYLIEVVGGLEQRGVQFRSLTEAIDTTTAGGRLLFGIMGSLAEFERRLVRERTMAGLEAARARGRLGGRPPALSADQVRTARQLYDKGELTVAEIGRVLAVSRTTVYRVLGPDRAPATERRARRPARAAGGAGHGQRAAAAS